MAMRDGFEDAKSTADLRERKWSSFYCSHRARSCHSHVWSFEITAALKSLWPIRLAGRWWSWGVTLSKGGNAAHGQRLAQMLFADCLTRMLRETPIEKHRSVNWNRLVRCWLSHTNKSFSSPMSSRQRIYSPKQWSGPLSTAGKQENRELENGSESSCMCFPRQPLLPAM